MQLLIDEHLTPRIEEWCLTRWFPPLHAVHVTRRKLGSTDDVEIWRYAWEHEFVVVTTNARDFLPLLTVEIHPGLIVIREGGLSREEQWARLSEVLDWVFQQPNPDAYMVNRVLEIAAPGKLVAREVPPP